MQYFDSGSQDSTHTLQRSTTVLETPMVVDMPMRTIVFSSQKGGSGKTTLCGQLAVQAELMNAGPVAVVDTDPQGSLSQWWNARKAEAPLFLKTRMDYLANDLEELRDKGIKLVFVDSPPAVTGIIEQIISHADLVMVPIRPSPHDLRAVGATLDIIEAQDKPLIFAVNGATPQAQITSETAVALSQHGTVAPSIIHQRTDFATSMINGGTVMESRPDSPSAAEIAELWQYIFSRLGKMERRRRRQTPFLGTDRSQPDQGHAYPEPVEATSQARATFGRRSSLGGQQFEKAV